MHIPTKPRTSRSVGFAFIDFATPQAADSARLQLSGEEILARKVSIQLARKPVMTSTAGTATDDRINGADGHMKDEESQHKSAGNANATKTDIYHALSWNPINGIRIRTTLGGSLGKGEIANEGEQDTGQKSPEPQTTGKLVIDLGLLNRLDGRHAKM